MNILFAVPYTPNLIRTRPYNFIRGLARRGHTITLATLWENQQEREALRGLEQSGIQVVAARLTKMRSVWNAFSALPTQIPLQAMYCWHPELFHLIDSQVSIRHFDILHIEHLRGARYGLVLKSCISNSNFPVFIWDGVDCISYLFEQATHTSRNLFGRFITRMELPRTRRYEAYLTDQFRQVLVTSEKDRQALIELRRTFRTASDDGMRIQVLSNGVDLDYFAPSPETAREPQTIVLTGKMSYHANITAALYLVNEVMPLVWRAKPDARVQIVGHRPPKELVGLGQRFAGRVQVTGTVPDIRPYLAKATVAAVPILYGAGIQNKVLEAMAMATPVVATSKAVSAISVQHGEQILLGDTPAEFASQILRLLDDGVLRQHLAYCGRQYIESSHDWNRITEKLEKIYAEAIAAGQTL